MTLTFETFERYADRLEAHRLVQTEAISQVELLTAIADIDRAVAA